MVFPSLPIYLDPSNNWNQHQSHQHPGGGAGGEANQLPPGLATATRPEAGMEAASIRPGSMAERARVAKLPQPEQGLKCPRCDSTNTKFCYFNNYSLSQPRHFCKTCRRYWTRGGALRSVPVGGGCRRNKRSKSSSKSSSAAASSADRQATGTSSSSSTATGGGALGAIAGSNVPLPPSHLFMASLHPLGDYGGAAANFGLGFPGIQPIDSLEFHIGSNSSNMGMEQWRLQQTQQFPFMAGIDPAQPPPAAATQPAVSSLYPFDGNDGTAGDNLVGQILPKASGASLITQMSSVKMEDRHHGLSFPRQYLGLHGNDDQYYWGASGIGSSSSAGWPGNFSNFNSSSSGNLL